MADNPARFKQEDFDQVIKMESAIAESLFPFAANTPTRLAIFALGRVLKTLLGKCDAKTRAVYSLAILETLEASEKQRPADPDYLARVHRFFN
jgi:hypothetical protein